MQLTERQLRQLIQEQVNKQIIKEAFELTRGGELAIKAAMKVLFLPLKFIPYIGPPLYIGLSWAVEKIVIIIATFMLGKLDEITMLQRIQNLMFITVDKIVNIDNKMAGKLRTGLDAFVAGLRLKYPALNDIYVDDFGEDGDKMVFALWLTSRIINVISHKKFAFIKFNRRKLPIDYRIIEGLGKIPAEKEITAARERLKEQGFVMEDEWSEDEYTSEDLIDVTPLDRDPLLLPLRDDDEEITDLIIPDYEYEDESSDDIELISIDDEEEEEFSPGMIPIDRPDRLLPSKRRPTNIKIDEAAQIKRILHKVFDD